MCEPDPPPRRAEASPAKWRASSWARRSQVCSSRRRSCGTRCLLPESGFGEKLDDPFTQGIGEALALLQRHFDASGGRHEIADPMDVERHDGKPTGHGFEDLRARRLTKAREKHDRARVVPVDHNRQRHLTQSVDRTNEAERFDLGRGGCIVETAAEHHELRRGHRSMHLGERMERQGDTLERKVPPDPEDRRGRATWNFALLVCNGFGQHRCVQAELNPCWRRGLAIVRLSRCWSPRRGRLPEPYGGLAD